MSHFRKLFKRGFRKGAGGRQEQQVIPLATSSASITSEDPSATGSKHVQQEQSRDSFSFTAPTDHQQPPAAQSLWDRAYDALAKELPCLVRDYDELLANEQMANSAPNETTTALQIPALHGHDTRSDSSPRQVQLNAVIRNGLQRVEDTKATYNIGGHEFVLADQITQVTNRLLWVKDWIGSAIRYSPEASVVWSGVCLILPLLTNPAIAAEANRDGFAYVTSRMRYYVALEPLLRRLGQNARVDEALLSAAKDHIVHLYQAILEFQLSSVLRFYQSRLKTFVHDIVPSKDWEQTRLNIMTREGIVNNDLGQINGLVARQELELLNETSEGIRAAMEDCLSVATQQLDVLSEQLTIMKQQQAAQEDARQERLLASKQQQAAQEDAKRERLLAKQDGFLRELYLTRNDNGASYEWYKDRVELRVDGTCNWFLQQENFQKWLSQESGPLLVSADPGCGKSVLAKYLIDHELTQQSATICYFFFKDQDQNTIRQALCALLHQLFSQNSALIRHAMGLYNSKGAAKLIQSESSLWTILRDAVRDPHAGPVIFVIDALDECDESQLSSLIRNMMDIFGDQQREIAKLKVLMTSRPYEQVVSHVYRSWDGDLTRIHIPGEEEFETISQEINNVIHYRVEQLARSHRLSDKTKSSLVSKLLAINHRTYLWVFLAFDYLDKKGFKKTEVGINAAIQTLPKTVNQAYDQILNRFRDDKTVETVKKALSIILAARRPLKLSEMNIAMNLDGQDLGQSIYDLDLEEDVDFKSSLRALCGLFVNVHHDTVYFFHQTAREFLIQSSAPTIVSSDLQWHHSITTRHAHSVLAEICMFYLDRLNSTNAEAFLEGDHHGALLWYSVEHWGDHCREAELDKGSVMVDLASRLCTPDLTSNSQWASIIPGWYNVRPESPTNVLIASYLGLTPVTELLLSRRADIEARDSQGKTALMLAADAGHEAVTRLLIDNGANVEAKNIYDWTALMLAADAGHEAVTRLLIDNGADVEAMDDDGWTALMLAAKFGREAVIRLLLDNGANIEATSDDGMTALMHAAGSGHEAATRLLLDSGANVNATSNDGRTVLMHTADSDHKAVTQLLLENGAGVEAKDVEGSTTILIPVRDRMDVADAEAKAARLAV